MPVLKGFDRSKALPEQVKIQTMFTAFAAANEVSVRDMETHKQEFDTMLETSDYANLHCYVVSFEGVPEFLCSGGLYPECDFAGKPLQYLGNLSKTMEEISFALIATERGGAFVFAWQHEAVEAGRPFAQLQEAGMVTVKLEEIVRQKDRELKNVVEQLARGEAGEAVQGLERQARVHEVKDPAQRIEAIAKEYARSPENTLVVSPDNRSRIEINAKIHSELQAKGIVGRDGYRIDTLVPRQDLTGADRTWAQRYERDNVLLYSRSLKEMGIERGEYARVKHIDAGKNLLAVVRADGSERTYDPHRQQGASIYQDQEKAFSAGDRLQFTAPAKSDDLKVANRELGTIHSTADDGRIQLTMNQGGRSVSFDPKQHLHLDHGYAVTSQVSQGQSADRVLIHIDTDLGAKDLLNNRMA